MSQGNQETYNGNSIDEKYPSKSRYYQKKNILPVQYIVVILET